MRELNLNEVDMLAGGARAICTSFNDIGIGLGAAAAVGGGLAAIPTPASPALAGFGVLAGLLGAGAAYLGNHCE